MNDPSSALLKARQIAHDHWITFESSSHQEYARAILKGEKDECEAVAVALKTIDYCYQEITNG